MVYCALLYCSSHFFPSTKIMVDISFIGSWATRHPSILCLFHSRVTKGSEKSKCVPAIATVMECSPIAIVTFCLPPFQGYKWGTHRLGAY